MQAVAVILIVVGCIIGIGLLTVSLVSFQEEEPRATKLSLALAFILPIPYLAVGFTDFASQTLIGLLLLGVTIAIPILFLLPLGTTFEPEAELPSRRFDERDIVFSRNLLLEGVTSFDEYYDRHPNRKALDDKFRSLPGLLKRGASQHDPVTASAADAGFRAVEAFYPMLDNERLSEPPESIDPHRITRFVKEWMKRLGAVSVGITKLEDYHLYSTIGRGEGYGEPVELSHKVAVAFTVEMDKYFMDRAPQAPTAMESARQYLNSGALAIQLAGFFRQLGYSSRAHIDGRYRVICPLVARDAGLGEIGRMGLLMTPELGPRVRIAVVTTDMELVPDSRKRDDTVMDFCTRCKKCAEACPSRAISFEDRTLTDGVRRWRINAEACFTLWCTIGTDCGRCVSVCPYSHPNNRMHNLVRSGIKQSALFRQAALKLDDLFYGRKPPPLELPDWIADVVERGTRSTKE